MTTRPSSRTLRARPRRFATSGAWRVAKGLRGSEGVYGLERRGRRAVVGGGGAGSEAIRGAIRRADAGQDANAVPGRGRSSGGGYLHRGDRGGHVSPGRLFWRWGTLSTEIWIIPLVAIALTQTAVVATSVYLHRTLAHRALAVHPVADVLFRTVLWLTTGQLRQEWVAVHRKHHAFTDREGDPHSPRLLGLWRVQLLNAYYYQREARNPDTIKKFAPDLPEDRLDRAVFSKGLVGPGLGIALLCLLFGIGPGLVVALAHAVLYVGVLAPLINGVGHWRGAQNFTNTAYNSVVLAWLTAGESLHNNHHAEPRAPKFSVRRVEFDPSWLLIRALAAVRLVAVVGPPLRLSTDSRAVR